MFFKTQTTAEGLCLKCSQGISLMAQNPPYHSGVAMSAGHTGPLGRALANPVSGYLDIKSLDTNPHSADYGLQEFLLNAAL